MVSENNFNIADSILKKKGKLLKAFKLRDYYFALKIYSNGVVMETEELHYLLIKIPGNGTFHAIF